MDLVADADFDLEPKKSRRCRLRWHNYVHVGQQWLVSQGGKLYVFGFDEDGHAKVEGITPTNEFTLQKRIFVKGRRDHVCSRCGRSAWFGGNRT